MSVPETTANFDAYSGILLAMLLHGTIRTLAGAVRLHFYHFRRFKRVVAPALVPVPVPVPVVHNDWT